MAGNNLGDWCVFQIGAREHYAVPRALSAVGERYLLFTDYWAKNSSSFRLPESLAQRTHPDIPDDRAFGHNRGLLRLEAMSRLQRTAAWEQIEARNAWFQRSARQTFLRQLKKFDRPPVVFAYSYAALDILKAAKAEGCVTVLGQIDPGPFEFELVMSLYERAGRVLAEQPSAQYWDAWREECAVADRIVVNSEWSKSGLQKAGVEESKLAVIPLAYEPEPGFDSRARRSETPPNTFSAARPLQVLFLGQLVVRKGILELAEAIRMMRGLPVYWTFVGGGEQWALDTLQSLPQTRVFGSVTRAETAHFYKEADLFILPTHSDGFALTQLEALSHGLPVVTSRYCGDVVENGLTGSVIPTVTPESIRKAIEAYLKNPEKLTKTQQATLNLERFSLESMGVLLMELARPGRPEVN